MGRAVAARPDLVARLRAAGCVFAEDEATLLADAATSDDGLDAMVARRVRGEPLELVVGWAEFCGHRVAVEPGVFVPRRRSEFLVVCAADGAPRDAVVVDLCCGSGGLALALAHLIAPRELHAADVSTVAVTCARRNLAAVDGQVHRGDLYDALPRRLLGRVDLLVVNAPYVPTAELPLLPAEARDHEPHAALDGGDDGVAVHRRVAAGAWEWLSPRGRVLVETSARQAPATSAAMRAAGLTVSIRRDDDADATVAVGERVSGSPRR